MMLAFFHADSIEMDGDPVPTYGPECTWESVCSGTRTPVGDRLTGIELLGIETTTLRRGHSNYYGESTHHC